MRSVTGDDHRGEGQQERAAGVQGAGIGAERIIGGAVRAPPRVGAREHVARRGRHGGNVLRGTPRRAQQPDRRAEFRPVSVTIDPLVPPRTSPNDHEYASLRNDVAA
jgi:hypothetical protein